MENVQSMVKAKKSDNEEVWKVKSMDIEIICYDLVRMIVLILCILNFLDV